MKNILFILIGCMAFIACDDPWENMEITVISPPAEGDTADVSYLIEWTVSNTDDSYDARIDLFADTDTDPSVGQVMIAESLSIESTAWVWECGLVPEGEYYIRALLYQGMWDTDDYSSGVLTIVHY